MRPSLRTDIASVIAIGTGTLISFGSSAALLRGGHRIERETLRVGDSADCATALGDHMVGLQRAAKKKAAGVEGDLNELAEIEAHEMATHEEPLSRQFGVDLSPGEIVIVHLHDGEVAQHRVTGEVAYSRVRAADGRMRGRCVLAGTGEEHVEVILSGPEGEHTGWDGDVRVKVQQR